MSGAPASRPVLFGWILRPMNWLVAPWRALAQAVARLGLRALAVTIGAMAILNVTILIAAGALDRDADLDLLAPPIIGQAASAAALMDALAPATRAHALRALNSPMLRVEMIDDFADTPTVQNPAPVFVPIIAAYAAALGDRPFSVYLRREDTMRTRALRRARIVDDLIVVMRLADGSGLLVEAGAAYRRRIALDVIGYVVGVVGLGLIGLMTWASLSYARPLGRLAEASERFAETLDGAPLAERGPRPVRDLAAALNVMRARLARLMAERTTTLAAIAHDMRTYLTRLRMRAEFIDDGAQRDKAIVDLDDMGRLLEDALSLGRVSAEPPPLTTTDLAAFLRDFAERRAEAAPGRLVWSVAAPAEGARALTSRPDLTRALDNLVDNALRYAGSAALTLSVGPGGDGSPIAEIALRDDGPGAPEAFLERITEPFTRLETSRSRETGGAGLGLAIAKARTERAGGVLQLSNHPSGGFWARIRLPLCA